MSWVSCIGREILYQLHHLRNQKNYSIRKSNLLHFSLWLEKAMAPHSSTLAWKIPWTEEPGRLQSMGSLRVRHDWATSLSLFTFMHWRSKWQPTPVFLPGESQGQRSLVAAVYGVTQSRIWLKWLSSSSSSLWLADYLFKGFIGRVGGKRDIDGQVKYKCTSLMPFPHYWYYLV